MNTTTMLMVKGQLCNKYCILGMTQVNEHEFILTVMTSNGKELLRIHTSVDDKVALISPVEELSDRFITFDELEYMEDMSIFWNGVEYFAFELWLEWRRQGVESGKVRM